MFPRKIACDMGMQLVQHPMLLAIAIFLLRITDVSIGTIRTLYTIRGKRTVAATLGFVESLVWIYAISRLVETLKENPFNMLAWAAGFSTGTIVGITIEQWIASGSILVRVISKSHALRLRELLQSEGYGVTAVQAQGLESAVLAMFVVTARKRKNELLASIQHVDPDAFITVEPVSHAIGGYPDTGGIAGPSPTTMKK